MAAPKGAKKPQDHAAKAEVKDLPIEFDFDGTHYSIDRANARNIELAEFTEDRQYIKAIRGYVGLDQWAKYKDRYRDEQGRVMDTTFEPFLNAVMAAIGGGPDESPNSSASSGS